MDLSQKIDSVKKNLEPTDFGFFLLRSIVLVGGLGWLSFSTIPPEESIAVLKIYFYYLFYTLFLYGLIFLWPWKVRRLYVIGLLFDLLFVFLLVRATGGFYSDFYLGFYLLTALHTFYYGLNYGIVLAFASSLVYLFGGKMDFEVLQWTDFMLRISFLFLMAVPLGILSDKLKKDKMQIEALNRELEKSMASLRQTQKRLVEVEKFSALGRLTADVAHEIRNPLTSIGGFARRLRENLADGSKERIYADLIVTESIKLEQTLRDVLIFSRGAGIQCVLLTAESVIDEYLDVAVILKSTDVSIKKEYGAAPLKALIDKEQLKQVLNNLIINALDAMSGQGPITLRTRIERLNEIQYIVIDVEDTGSGIPDDKLGIIFEPFYSTKSIGAGTGLGLAICKKIMDEHNGLIKVRSKLNEGSTFSLYFPLQSEEDKDKIKCWQFMECGIESDSEMTCGAYPDFGRMCWAVAGTFCEKKVQGKYAQKITDCSKCDFFRALTAGKSGQARLLKS